MKILATIALALITTSTFAQKPQHHQDRNHHDRMEMMKDLTPQEMAELKTKKMTLHLDLTDSQQKEMMALNLELAKTQKAKMQAREKQDKKPELSKEERLAKMNEKLDHQIATKKRVKNILDEEQFEKWERMMAKKQRGKKKGAQRR
ncbi:MAG: hypothetical protein BM564_08100 [Bacteroidetes bacterium MedPE-SWsnd-G2]|nr:MAG: hypothetical protein BM564_08100 [Bacteroidetes bacterium MedPE-SWsnd-G2]